MPAKNLQTYICCYIEKAMRKMFVGLHKQIGRFFNVKDLTHSENKVLCTFKVHNCLLLR